MPSWFLGKERSHTCSFGFLSGRSRRSQHVLTQFFFSSQARTIDCLSKFSEITQMKFAHVCNVTDSDLSVFKDNLFHSSYIFFSVLLIDDHSEHLLPSSEVTPLLKMGNHPKTCVLPVVCSPESTFNILEVHHFFPHFKTCCSLKSAIFLGMPKSQVEQHTHVLNKILLTLTHATALFQAWTDLPDSTWSTSSSRDCY